MNVSSFARKNELGVTQIKSSKRLFLVSIVAITCILTLGGITLLYIRLGVQRPVTRWEEIIASMPINISAEQAEALIGSSPDQIMEEKGYFISPVTMIAASEANNQKYGSPKVYSLKVWYREGVTCVVAVDSDGKVAGRWSGRDR